MSANDLRLLATFEVGEAFHVNATYWIVLAHLESEPKTVVQEIGQKVERLFDSRSLVEPITAAELARFERTRDSAQRHGMLERLKGMWDDLDVEMRFGASGYENAKSKVARRFLMDDETGEPVDFD